MKELDRHSVESSELVESTFDFWFSDNEHIRSPFPNYIRIELKVLATERFYQWVNGLKPEAKDELNDESVGEKFEEIIFETASELIKTEDERLTILYPFLPRTQDELTSDSGEKSVVVDRSIVKEGDNRFMKIILEKIDNKERWNTKFELPI
ncbi:MAG: hypothetical protein ACLGGV_00175 [Bacteroidia bacterium]